MVIVEQRPVVQLQRQRGSIWQSEAIKPRIGTLVDVGRAIAALPLDDIDPLSSRIDCRSQMSMLSHGFSPKEAKGSVQLFIRQG